MLYGKDIKFGIYKLADIHKKQISNFYCGTESIDEFLKERAYEEMESGNSVTKVVIIEDNKSEDNGKIIAYYSLSASSIVIEDHEQKYFFPAAELRMFAVLDKLHGLDFTENKDEGTFSEYLFSSIIYDIYELSENAIGIQHVVLYSVPKAYNFYEKIGFKDFTKLMVRSNDRYLNGCIPMCLNLNS